MYVLPTRSPVKYTGKHPQRIRHWGYADSPAQRAIGKYLGLTKPVHIELYSGARFIADMAEVDANGARCGVNVHMILRNKPTLLNFLPQERYDEMLEIIRRIRDQPRKVS